MQGNQGNNYEQDHSRQRKSQKCVQEAIRQEQQQESVEEQIFRIQDLPIYKENQREKLIEQNIKLKTQIYQLAKQLDEILIKNKEKRKCYGLRLNPEDEDQSVKQKRLLLSKQQIDIQESKNKIFMIKRELEMVYNNQNIRAKEDKIAHLKLELKGFEAEKQGLLNIQKQQFKALKLQRNEESIEPKIQKIKEKHHQTRQKCKEKYEQVNVKLRVLRVQHSKYVDKIKQLKQIESKICLNRQKGRNKKKGTHEIIITEDMINQLEEEIRYAEKNKIEGQKIWKDKIKCVDDQIKSKKTDDSKRLAIMKEKSKELKVSQYRIKELRKYVRQSQVIETQFKQQDIDMTQFRHKRNIRYLEK